jgi:hypothetical protein
MKASDLVKSIILPIDYVKDMKRSVTKKLFT